MRPFSLDAPGSPPCDGPSQPYRNRKPRCGSTEGVRPGHWGVPLALCLPLPRSRPYLLRLLDDDEVGAFYWRTESRGTGEKHGATSTCALPVPMLEVRARC